VVQRFGGELNADRASVGTARADCDRIALDSDQKYLVFFCAHEPSISARRDSAFVRNDNFGPTIGDDEPTVGLGYATATLKCPNERDVRSELWFG
jgi:hypothetical protein